MMCTVRARTCAHLSYAVLDTETQISSDEGSRAVVRFEYQGALVSRASNNPKYKPSILRKESNQSSSTKRALSNALNFTDWRGPESKIRT